MVAFAIIDIALGKRRGRTKTYIVFSPLVADKLYAAIKSKKTAIVNIIKEMPDDK